jgi:hypothetical protein
MILNDEFGRTLKKSLLEVTEETLDIVVCESGLLSSLSG